MKKVYIITLQDKVVDAKFFVSLYDARQALINLKHNNCEGEYHIQTLEVKYGE